MVCFLLAGFLLVTFYVFIMWYIDKDISDIEDWYL